MRKNLLAGPLVPEKVKEVLSFWILPFLGLFRKPRLNQISWQKGNRSPEKVEQSEVSTCDGNVYDWFLNVPCSQKPLPSPQWESRTHSYVSLQDERFTWQWQAKPDSLNRVQKSSREKQERMNGQETKMAIQIRMDTHFSSRLRGMRKACRGSSVLRRHLNFC